MNDDVSDHEERIASLEVFRAETEETLLRLSADTSGLRQELRAQTEIGREMLVVMREVLGALQGRRQ